MERKLRVIDCTEKRKVFYSHNIKFNEKERKSNEDEREKEAHSEALIIPIVWSSIFQTTPKRVLMRWKFPLRTRVKRFLGGPNDKVNFQISME